MVDMDVKCQVEVAHDLDGASRYSRSRSVCRVAYASEILGLVRRRNPRRKNLFRLEIRVQFEGEMGASPFPLEMEGRGGRKRSREKEKENYPFGRGAFLSVGRNCVWVIYSDSPTNGSPTVCYSTRSAMQQEDTSD